MRKRTAFLVGGAVTALVVVAAIGTAGTRRAAVATARRGAIAGAGPRGVSNLEQRYRVSLDYATSQLAVEMAGVWAVGVVESSVHQTSYRAQLRAATVQVTRDGRRTVDRELAAALASAYTFTVAPDGKLTGFGFVPQLDARARGALVALAATLQHVTGTGGSWAAIEADALGDHRVAYHRDASGLTRTKLRYLGDEAPARVRSSTGTIALRADGWPARITADDVLQVGPADVAIEVTSHVRLEHAGTASAAFAMPKDLEPIAIAALRVRPGDDPEADRELVDGASATDLLAELAQVTEDGHAAGYLFLRLAALYRLDAEAARAGARDVIGGTQPLSRFIVGALGEAGTPAAQAALADVLGRSRDPEVQVHAAASLGLAREPTADTIATLARTAAGSGEVADTATLAVGNAAYQLRDPARTGTQLDMLLARLRAAGDDSEAALCLRALGNLGDPRSLDAIAAALASDRGMLRIAAAESVRRIPGPRADQLLIAALGDPLAEVRAAAVFAAGYRDLEALAAPLGQVLRREGELPVRRSIVELAIARHGEVPALRSIISYASEHERDAELRAAAATALR